MMTGEANFGPSKLPFTTECLFIKAGYIGSFLLILLLSIPVQLKP